MGDGVAADIKRPAQKVPVSLRWAQVRGRWFETRGIAALLTMRDF
jgi:hypothetical protein